MEVSSRPLSVAIPLINSLHTDLALTPIFPGTFRLFPRSERVWAVGENRYGWSWRCPQWPGVAVASLDAHWHYTSQDLSPVGLRKACWGPRRRSCSVN
jgi:hypothetical protein